MKKKPVYLWKFLRSALKSKHGNCTWAVGKWKHLENATVSLCNQGFHASEKILDALSYVKGEILAKVEVKGASDKQADKQADKQCWASMRIVKAYRWSQADSIQLSIFSAELVLKNFEKLYPEDKRPRQAIEAAKAYLKNSCEETRSAAYSADSADSAARRL